MNNFPKIPATEFISRINNFKKIMEREKIDIIVIYSNFIDPSSVRYFSNFYAVNESSAMIIPLKEIRYFVLDKLTTSGQNIHR